MKYKIYEIQIIIILQNKYFMYIKMIIYNILVNFSLILICVCTNETKYEIINNRRLGEWSFRWIELIKKKSTMARGAKKQNFI
jgi:hypothetical protein